MDSSSRSPSSENGVQGVEKMKKEKEATLCSPFCEVDCEFQGEHDHLIVWLVNLQEKDRASLDAWKEYIISLKYDLNKPSTDPKPSFRYPLLHWAAMLGKVKAVQWLLTEDHVSLKKDNTQGISNKTVVFSMVRYLHEGVKTKDPNRISKVFVTILDSLLKHDPYLLLIQEDVIGDTVLHLCARGEQDSNAPFLKYLKTTLVKLQEISAENEKLPLKNILEKKNKQGDTFIDVAAKSQSQKDAKDLIDFIKDKFIILSTKTAEDILKKRELDERQNEDDFGVDDDDDEYVGKDGGDDEGEDEVDDAPLSSTYNRKEELEVNSKFETGRDPDQASPAKIRKISDESPTFPKDPLAVGVNSQLVESNLQHLDDVSESKVTPFAVEDPVEGSVGTSYGVESGSRVQSTGSVVSATELTERIARETRELIQIKEQELSQEKCKLKKTRLSLVTKELRLGQLQMEKDKEETEVKEMEKKVNAIEEKVRGYKEILTKFD